MTRGAEPAWTFYGRQECDCCEEAANLLLLLLDGHAITVRMIDLRGPEEAPTAIHRLPALMDGQGRVIWQGSFDSQATEQAWQASVARRRPPRPRADSEVGFDPEDARPLPNGLQS